MKKLLFAFCFVVGISAFAQEIQFDNTTIDYGVIEQGSDGVRKFEFTNTGSAPLIISGVSTSCGCTVADYTKTPLMKGERGVISVKYNTSILGGINKKIYVNSNAPKGRTTLTIVGTVKQ